MGILVVVGILFGMILGQFFKCFVLIPASGLAIILVLANPAHIEHSLLGWFLQIVVLITSLQIGYVVGGLVAFPLHLSVRKRPASAVSTRDRQLPLRNLGVAEERHDSEDARRIWRTRMNDRF